MEGRGRDLTLPTEADETDLDRFDKTTEEIARDAHSSDARKVLTLEEIGNLGAEGGQPAETLMNVVALIAKRFGTDVCSAYLLEPDRAHLVLAATVGPRRDMRANP
jgi:hypothetical protein